MTEVQMHGTVGCAGNATIEAIDKDDGPSQMTRNRPEKSANATCPGLATKKPGRRVLFVVVGLLLLVGLTVGYAFFVEPTWIAERTIVLREPVRVRIVHITDMHYHGDREYLERVVDRINAVPADIVCVTGDIVDDLRYLDDALEILGGVAKPMYGVRGNHDCWDDAGVADIIECFRSTGGAWLLDEQVTVSDGRISITGSTGNLQLLPPEPDVSVGTRVLLLHDPGIVDSLGDGTYDLILAGHTHGGQLRVPGVGPLLDLPLVGKYDRGLFRTRAGPLYVNPGLGTYGVPARFGCRPEIAIIEL